MTVRDERDLLRSNLLYHHFIGVDRCYIYDDGSVDGTRESVQDLPFVEIRPSTDGWQAPVPSHFGDVLEESRGQFAYRQLLNVMDATARAAADGVSWLLAIDADELVAIELKGVSPQILATRLDRLGPQVEGVVFATLEVLQRRLRYDDVLTQETLFKRIQTDATRETYDPFAKVTRRVRVVYGHRAGKMAIRVAPDVVPHSAHRFTRRDGTALRTVGLGHLLHYYSHDWAAFVRKFRLMKDHLDHHVHGDRVVMQKRLWRDVVNRAGLDDEQLRDYYARWVMFDEASVASLSRRPRLPWRGAAVVEVTTVRDTLLQLDRGRPP